MSVVDSAPDASGATCCGLATTPVTAEDAARLAPMFKALGDPVRLQMASMIAASAEVCVCEITPAFELSSGTISHHLKTLREAGLVDCERRGTFVYYWIRPGALDALSRLLAVQEGPQPHRSVAAQTVERRTQAASPSSLRAAHHGQ